jgi:hypothetical protein
MTRLNWQYDPDKALQPEEVHAALLDAAEEVLREDPTAQLASVEETEAAFQSLQDCGLGFMLLGAVRSRVYPPPQALVTPPWLVLHSDLPDDAFDEEEPVAWRPVRGNKPEHCPRTGVLVSSEWELKHPLFEVQLWMRCLHNNSYEAYLLFSRVDLPLGSDNRNLSLTHQGPQQDVWDQLYARLVEVADDVTECRQEKLRQAVAELKGQMSDLRRLHPRNLPLSRTSLKGG